MHAGLVGFQKRMGALAEALQQQQGACSGGAFSGGACSGSSAIQVMLQCCAEVVRRIEDPTTLLPGMLGRRTRAGNALYAQWQARACARAPRPCRAQHSQTGALAPPLRPALHSLRPFLHRLLCADALVPL
jgi:hypothetical protein